MNIEDEILDHWQNPLHKGTLDNATHRGGEVNSMCGDEVQYELVVTEHGAIAVVRFQLRACVLTSALADMLAEKVTGMHPSLIPNINMSDMIPGVKVGFNRRKCVELPKLALLKALQNGQTKDQGVAGTGTDNSGRDH